MLKKWYVLIDQVSHIVINGALAKAKKAVAHNSTTSLSSKFQTWPMLEVCYSTLNILSLVETVERQERMFWNELVSNGQLVSEHTSFQLHLGHSFKLPTLLPWLTFSKLVWWWSMSLSHNNLTDAELSHIYVCSDWLFSMRKRNLATEKNLDGLPNGTRAIKESSLPADSFSLPRFSVNVQRWPNLCRQCKKDTTQKILVSV